jgi:hypothetical protein
MAQSTSGVLDAALSNGNRESYTAITRIRSPFRRHESMMAKCCQIVTA